MNYFLHPPALVPSAPARVGTGGDCRLRRTSTSTTYSSDTKRDIRE